MKVKSLSAGKCPLWLLCYYCIYHWNIMMVKQDSTDVVGWGEAHFCLKKMQINHKMYCLACNIPENNEKLCNNEPKPKATPSQCLFCQVSTSVVIKIKYNYSDDCNEKWVNPRIWEAGTYHVLRINNRRSK